MSAWHILAAAAVAAVCGLVGYLVGIWRERRGKGPKQ